MKKKNTKILISVSAILMIAIFVLLYVVFKDKDEVDETTLTEALEMSTEYVTEEVSDEDTTSEEVTEAEIPNSAKKKAAVNVEITKNNEWESDGLYFAQFDVKINNTTSEKLKKWEINIPVSENAKLDNIWNGKDNLEKGVLKITAVEFNKEIAANSKLGDIGFILKTKDKKDFNSIISDSFILIDGKEYKIEGNGDSKAGAKSDKDIKDSDEKKDTKTDSKKDKENSKDTKKENTEKKSEGKTPFEVHGQLAVKGTDLVDANGEKFQLKGLSTHGIAWFPAYVNKDAFAYFRDDWGANLIRLAMYTDENMGYCVSDNKEETKKLVESGVDYATELGMYVIVDWHILHDQNPNVYKDEAKIFFEEITKKYKDNKNVIYEICNEPNGSTTWEDVKSYAEEVIPIIRKNAPDAIIIVGTPTWSQDVDIASNNPITGYDNIMYAVHFYAATHTDNIRNKVVTAVDNGLPVFVSEFSICDASGNGAIDYDQAEKWFELINKYNLSYAAWNISNKDETSSIIKSSSSSVSGWTDDELSDTGVWIKNEMKK